MAPFPIAYWRKFEYRGGTDEVIQIQETEYGTNLSLYARKRMVLPLSHSSLPLSLSMLSLLLCSENRGSEQRRVKQGTASELPEALLPREKGNKLLPFPLETGAEPEQQQNKQVHRYIIIPKVGLGHIRNNSIFFFFFFPLRQLRDDETNKRARERERERSTTCTSRNVRRVSNLWEEKRKG